MALFRYDPAVLDRFPTIRGGMIWVHGVHNGPTPPDAAEAYRAEQQAVIERIGETPLSELPSLNAWRRAFSAFGVKPTQYRSAAEALLRRLTKQGDIPSLNLLVDLGNMISIRYGLPIAMLDLSRIAPPITVRLASGGEGFTTLDSGEVDHPAPGEVIFTDEKGLVVARRWCWRQSDESAARDTTTELLVTIEGHHPAAETDVRAAMDDLSALLARYAAPGTIRSALLSPSNPVFAPDEGA